MPPYIDAVMQRKRTRKTKTALTPIRAQPAFSFIFHASHA